MRWWDIAPVIELEKVLFPDEPWTAEAFWAELAIGPARLYLVAEPDGEPDRLVGYAGLSCPVDARGADAEIMTVGVASAVQGRGLGRALVDALCTAAEARGAGRVLLEVRSDNTVARDLYAAAGFEQVAVRPAYYRKAVDGATPVTVDALVLSLRLTAAAAQPDSVTP